MTSSSGRAWGRIPTLLRLKNVVNSALFSLPFVQPQRRESSLKLDNLFGSQVDEVVTDAMDLEDTTIDLVMTGSLQEKLNMLDVEVDLQVSVFAGLVEQSLLGAYLGEERKSARNQSMCLLYKLKTVSEEIMIRQNKTKIDMAVLKALEEQAADATHVVVGIDWGAVCSVTCEYENKEGEDATKIQGDLRVELEKLKGLVDVEGPVEAAYGDENIDINRNFTFQCKTDVLTSDKDLPVTFEGAVELARSFPSLVKGTNNGKGVPLTYMMMPLDAVIKMCRLQVQHQVKYTTISEGAVKQCAQVVEGITKKRQALYDIQNDLHAFQNYVPDDPLNRICDVFDRFVVEESSFKASLQDVVKGVRAGQKEVSSLEAFLNEGLHGILSDSKYNEEIRAFDKDLDKIRSVKSFLKRAITYLGKGDELNVDDKPNVYVFYKSVDEDDKKNRDKNQHFFLRLRKTHYEDDSNKFVIVDKEISRGLWPSTDEKATIYKFVNGRQVTRNLYAEEGQDSEICLIKIVVPISQPVRPSKRTYVELRCPNALSAKSLCTGNPTTWVYSKCKTSVEYGIETECFYCKCGESDPSKSLFRCDDKNHGVTFIKYPDDILKTELSRHRALKEKNILILGETGVGKSTWINGFHNYLNYEDLEQAMNSEELDALIPSSFTFTGAEEEKEICVGERSDNERLEVGKSSTIDPHTYVFHVGEYRVRLIDTPGIGDIGGMEQDKKNFDNILSCLTYYDEIHAICILLKPNNSRLTAMFQFCIQELLAHLHSSAKKNIVFCFTNARATFYKPGDTLPALNKLLRERNVGIQATPRNYFCFDNEPFRFLACLKNGLKFSDREIQTFAESWSTSVAETRRLFQHIQGLPPHQVKNTVSLNEARRIILAMSKPLAEVAETIERNLLEGEEVKREIDQYDKDVKDLEGKLRFSGYDLKQILLEHPRTVCTHRLCVKHVQVGVRGANKTLYEQICHDKCIMLGVSPETPNSFLLRFCQCFTWGGFCTKCEHRYEQHMHMTYDTELVCKEFLSKEVQTDINRIGDEKGKKEAFKRKIDEKCQELRDEEQFIMKTSAKFGSYIKANALIPYNDAVGDYLDMSIELESNKEKEIRNDVMLTRLRDMKTRYMKDRQILDGALGTDTSENINSPEEVMKLQKALFRLKHFGKTLENFFQGISILHSANSNTFQETAATIRQHKHKKGDETFASALGRKLGYAGKKVKEWFSG